MSLCDIVISKIRKEGPQSFHDLMEMALYHPEYGYYTQNCRPEADGNESELQMLYGRLLGMQLEEMWKLLDRKPFTVVEYGTGLGTLCKDILHYLKNIPELYDQLRYCIIGKTPPDAGDRRTALCGKAEWFSSIDEIPFQAGCILSNEALDHLPIHEVVMQKQLMEIYVDYKDGFVEVLEPAGEELKDYLEEMQVVLPAGYRTEINMQAIRWLQQNAGALKKGFLLTIECGCHADEFFSLSRHRGNLSCFQAGNAIYQTLGQHDIMAHVNFSALHHWGNRFGLECCGYTSQAHFLHGIGLLPELDEACKATPSLQREKNGMVQLYRKIMTLSNKFKILVQQKGLQRPKLAGLTFAKAFV